MDSFFHLATIHSIYLLISGTSKNKRRVKEKNVYLDCYWKDSKNLVRLRHLSWHRQKPRWQSLDWNTSVCFTFAYLDNIKKLEYSFENRHNTKWLKVSDNQRVTICLKNNILNSRYYSFGKDFQFLVLILRLCDFVTNSSVKS